MFVLLYKGIQGEHTLKHIKGEINKALPEDKNSHMFKHSIDHPTMTLDNFTVLSSGYRNMKFKRKVSESLFIKQNRPTLNKHGPSAP